MGLPRSGTGLLLSLRLDPKVITSSPSLRYIKTRGTIYGLQLESISLTARPLLTLLSSSTVMILSCYISVDEPDQIVNSHMLGRYDGKRKRNKKRAQEIAREPGSI